MGWKKVANRPGIIKKKHNYIFSHSSVISNVVLIFYDNIKYKFITVGNCCVYTLPCMDIIQEQSTRGLLLLKQPVWEI